MLFRRWMYSCLRIMSFRLLHLWLVSYTYVAYEQLLINYEESKGYRGEEAKDIKANIPIKWWVSFSVPPFNVFWGISRSKGWCYFRRWRAGELCGYQGENKERNTLRPRFLLSLSDIDYTHTHTLWLQLVVWPSFGTLDVDSSSFFPSFLLTSTS
jgi:hypothetical protein